MTAAPILYGRLDEDGTMELLRGGKPVGRLLSASAISEALSYGWIASDGWRDRRHQVILLHQVHDICRLMLQAAVAATGGASVMQSLL